jgi:hypothetical protein
VNREIAIALGFFVACHTIGWFGNALQFMSRWWEARPLITVAIFALPTGACAYFATRYAYPGFGGSMWGARFLGFSASWLVFPLLTWALMGESMFTTKTLVCMALSFAIMAVQIYG